MTVRKVPLATSGYVVLQPRRAGAGERLTGATTTDDSSSKGKWSQLGDALPQRLLRGG